MTEANALPCKGGASEADCPAKVGSFMRGAEWVNAKIQQKTFTTTIARR
jgi:hypothetical protein